MRNDSISERNHFGKPQQHLQGNAQARSAREADDAYSLDMWSTSARNRRLNRDTDEEQKNNAGDESCAASGFGAIYANVLVEGECSAPVGGAISNTAAGTSAVEAEADVAAAMDMLEPMSASDGMFEVIMPNGQCLGVVVSTTAKQVSFLLSPPDRALGDRFKRNKSLMENRLAGRVGKLVELTVL